MDLDLSICHSNAATFLLHPDTEASADILDANGTDPDLESFDIITRNIKISIAS
jgi:hypothetical protein